MPDIFFNLAGFSPDAQKLISGAQGLADELNHPECEPLHLFSLLLKIPAVGDLFKEAGSNVGDLKAFSNAYLEKIAKRKSPGLSGLNSALLDLLTRAEKEANRSKEGNVPQDAKAGVEHLVLSLVRETKGYLGQMISGGKINPSKVKANIAILRDGASLQVPKYFQDLTAKAKEGKLDPIVGRDNELQRLIQILGRRNKNHPILVGENGVGKKTLVNALAQKLAGKGVSLDLASRSVLQLDTILLTSSVKLRSEIEDRMKQVLKETKSKNVILYIHSLETLLGQQSMTNGIGDILSSWFLRDDICLIASTTPDGLRKLTEKNEALVRHFTTLTIEPATVEHSIQILRGVAKRYEEHHNIKIGDPAITSAVKLAKRYVQNKFLPEAAIDLMDEAASRRKLELDGYPTDLISDINHLSSLKTQLTGLMGDEDEMSVETKDRLNKEIAELNPKVDARVAKIEENRTGNVVSDRILSAENVATVLENWTGIPCSKMLEGDDDKYKKMEERIAQKVVGQDDAVKAVAKAVRRSRAGLRDTRKPIGSFLFLGASGVGKTQLAKSLAEFLFDDEQAMIRIDCSEMQQGHMVARLLGSPTGYVGSDEGGQLTEAVKKKPYSVVLFDEIEKAHPDIFNILLQVLDDGRLTDGRGRLADFSNTVIILTSNIGSKKILETDPKTFQSEDGMADFKIMIRKELTEFLRPELLNRLDNTGIFQPFSRESLLGILDIQIRELEKLMSDRKVTLSLTQEVKEALIDIDYTPAYGARPLKRAIASNIQDPLAEGLVSGKFGKGAHINVSMDGNKFVLESK